MLRSVLDQCTIIRIQSWESETHSHSPVEDVLGVTWPPNTPSVAPGRCNIICVGPTDWLVITPDPDATPLLQRLNEAFDGSACRSTNVSQALVRIQIDGPEVRDLLAKGCSLDLHPPLFPPGRAARTRFAGMPVIVHCTGTSKFELIVTQSYSDYLLSWLEDAALEFSGTAV